jgi:PAS domain S-box-containing protein
MVLVLVLFASVFALRLVIENPEQPAALLYSLPVALVAIEYGARAGLFAAGVALALFALYTGIEDAGISAFGWTMRGFVFLLIGGLLGRLSDRLRHAREALAGSEGELQAILDNAPAVMHVKDRDGRYLLVNRRYEKLFNVTEEGVTGKTDYDLFPKYAADSFRAADRKVLKGGEPVEMEEVIPHRDGPHTYISVKFPLQDAAGETYGICGISTDITARIAAEQQLRESKEQFRRIIDTAHDAFVSINADSIITGWNQEAQATFGWSREQVVGKSILDLIIPERFHDKHREGIKRFLETGGGPVFNGRVELRAIHRNGHEFPIELGVAALKTKAGYVFNAFLHDITGRKRAEELARIKTGLERQTAELQRSNQELAQFAHVASHDLAEPLQTVARYVQLLENRYRGRLDSDADEFIGFAVEGASRMQELIEGLRAYSTVGSSEYVPMPVDCGQAARRAVAALELTIRERGAVVTVDQLPTVIGDAGQLCELFQNLISNAIKFCEAEASRVHVSAERTEEGWSFAIADNGIGIKREYAQRVFEMFRRMHGDRGYGGTGIGLTICRKVVTRHGGRIWVESGIEGGGSVFRFTIPDPDGDVEAAELTPLPAGKARPANGALNGEKERAEKASAATAPAEPLG